MVTNQDIARLRMQAEIQALQNTRVRWRQQQVSDWRLLVIALTELEELRQWPEGTLIQRRADKWLAMTPDGVTHIVKEQKQETA